MSCPLSREERNLTLRRHIPELPRIHQCVRESLRAGSKTAPAIHHQTGLPVEVVYQSLVWLEARGKASLVVAQGRKVDVEWAAK
jgi:hypothetical protein